MREITIVLNDGQYEELTWAAILACEQGFTEADWAREAVESCLASRRLPSVSHGRNGARMSAEEEPKGHRVVRPETVGCL
jgi:hypothetical protein